MKKSLGVLIALLTLACVLSASAQVIFYADFESAKAVPNAEVNKAGKYKGPPGTIWQSKILSRLAVAKRA